MTSPGSMWICWVALERVERVVARSSALSQGHTRQSTERSSGVSMAFLACVPIFVGLGNPEVYQAPQKSPHKDNQTKRSHNKTGHDLIFSHGKDYAAGAVKVLKSRITQLRTWSVIDVSVTMMERAVLRQVIDARRKLLHACFTLA